MAEKEYHVIIGGLGGLGRALQKKLLDGGDDDAQQKKKLVRVVDLTPTMEAATPRLVDPTRIEYVSCTLSSSADNNEILKDALRDADTVYCVITPDVFGSTAAQMKETNVDGIQSLLEACEAVGVPKLVYASSMGVTNQMLPHEEETEETPLSPLEEYLIPYDKTKRQGEELVLQAATNTDSSLQACALRLGSIIASPPGDLFSRKLLETPGYILSASHTAPMDFLSANDIATAFVLASNNMHKVNGKAIYITKPRNNEATTVEQIMTLLASELDWKCIHLPPVIVKSSGYGYRAWKSLKRLIVEENSPGMPLDCLIQAQYQNMTFDNTRAHSLLGWEPQETWQDAILRLAKEFRQMYPEMFQK